jgi:pectate lyase
MNMKTPQTSIKMTVSTLTVILCGLARSAFGVDGWATQGGTTTGGAGGSTVTVSTLSAFSSAVTGTTARIINVSGTINLGSSNFQIGSNKTINGVGANSGFIGDLFAKSQKNLILQNLNFTNPSGVGDADGLTLQKTNHYFVTHCTFKQCADGEFDQTHACDYGTVSYCKFLYTSDTGHNFVNLIGHSDSNSAEDTGHLRITMHHNWYSTLCKERMPRVRFGQVHVYNNYYGAGGSNYCVGLGNNSQVLLQNCYFDSQSTPWKNYSSSGHQGLIHWSGNVYVNTTQPTWAPNSTVFTPPYSYSLTAGSNVKSTVTAASSGAGTH